MPHLLLVHSATREGTATTNSTGQDLSPQRRLGIFLSLSFCNCIFSAVVTFKSCFELFTSFLDAGTHATGGPGLCLTRVVKAQTPKTDNSSSPNPYSLAIPRWGGGSMFLGYCRLKGTVHANSFLKYRGGQKWACSCVRGERQARSDACRSFSNCHPTSAPPSRPWVLPPSFSPADLKGPVSV